MLVSILVFLEVPLQQRQSSSFQSLLYSFNPCFSGSSTATISLQLQLSVCQMSFNPCFSGSSTATALLLQIANLLKKFQSLFFWKFHCNPTIADVKEKMAMMFQSLFFWKFHCNLLPSRDEYIQEVEG